MQRFGPSQAERELIAGVLKACSVPGGGIPGNLEPERFRDFKDYNNRF